MFVVRMKRIAGQVEGLIKMYQAQRPCEEIIQQLLAVKSAFSKAAVALLKEKACRQLRGKNKEEIARIIDGILKVK